MRDLILTSKKPPAFLTMEKLTSILDDALSLLKESSYLPEQFCNAQDTPASLLDQCLRLCDQHKAVKSPEPIRTVHHFACTGGTLISKCIAAMPNTQLLSEVDPLSDAAAVQAKKTRFAPTDVITLMRQSTRGIDAKLIIDLFLNNLGIIYSESIRLGQRLVLRDHAHGHFCVGLKIPERPSLREIISTRFETLSLVTVRHPIDSFLALKNNEWVHFTPSTFDEYCRRYMLFLESYKDVPVIRYEDFVNNPSEVMPDVCNLLKVPFNGQFVDLFSVLEMSGDSGRRGGQIKRRPRRKMIIDVSGELNKSINYRNLCEKLDYSKFD